MSQPPAILIVSAKKGDLVSYSEDVKLVTEMMRTATCLACCGTGRADKDNDCNGCSAAAECVVCAGTGTVIIPS